jgi:hypothetical protein
MSAAQVDHLHDSGPAGFIGAHLDEHELALDGVVALQLHHLDDVDQLVELLRHLLEGSHLSVDDDRHPRDGRTLGLPHRQGRDIEAAAGKQPRDPGQDARLVLHQDRQRVHGRHDSVLHSPVGGQALRVADFVYVVRKRSE